MVLDSMVRRPRRLPSLRNPSALLELPSAAPLGHPHHPSPAATAANPSTKKGLLPLQPPEAVVGSLESREGFAGLGGFVLITDTGNDALRALNPSLTHLHTVVAPPSYISKGSRAASGSASGLRLSSPQGMCLAPSPDGKFDGSGGVVVCDTRNHRLLLLHLAASARKSSAATGSSSSSSLLSSSEPPRVALKVKNWRVLCGDENEPGHRDSVLEFKRKPAHEVRGLQPGEATGLWVEKAGTLGGAPAGRALLEAPRAVVACPNGNGLLFADGENQVINQSIALSCTVSCLPLPGFYYAVPSSLVRSDAPTYPACLPAFLR